MKIFSAIQGMLVIILLQPIQGLYFENYSKWYSCHVDFCNWEKYCDPFAKRCEDCSEKFKDCFTPAQESNCTIYCVTYQPCPPLKPLLHGHHNGSDSEEYTYGRKVTFTCDPGYQNLGVTETTCQHYGKWSHLQLNASHPICNENRCSIPHPPAHGRVSFSPDITEFVVGSQIFYSCEAGYQIQGNDSNRTCLTDGTWSGTIPDCVETSINHWMIAAIAAGCLLLLVATIYLCQRERKKYENVPKSKVPGETQETDEESSDTTLLHDKGEMKDMKSTEFQKVWSLKKKAVLPSSPTGQVVNQFMNSKVFYGNNNAILENHKEETRPIDPKESNGPGVTTCAFKETGIDLVMTSFDPDKNVECEGKTAIEIAGDTDHLIAEETEPAFP